VTFHLRDARPADARPIADLVEPYAHRRILVSKELISYFEDIQEFLVAEPYPWEPPFPPPPDLGQGTARVAAPQIVGCGALHVMWDDIAEVRTLAVRDDHLHLGLGSALLEALIGRARRLGLRRVFCLTFEVDFFARHGFHAIEGTPVGQDVYAQMLRSHDDGVREFLDLAAVKPNTLGNTRMLLDL